MFGTRFFVFQLKDLIRVGVITLIGLILVIAALIFLLPGRRASSETSPPPQSEAVRFIAGTYSSKIILNDEPVHVHVTVSETEILSISMSDLADLQRTFYPLFEPRLDDLAEEIMRYQNAGIEPRTDYPVTTGILQQAVMAALAQAYYE